MLDGAKDMISKLTDKQRKFCYEYVLHLNATRAAINAGYSESTAYSIGWENLRKPEISQVIDYMRSNLAETAEISALRILKEHEKLAFSSIAHLHDTWIEKKDFETLTDDERASIKSIATTVVKRNIGTSKKPDIVDVEMIKIELFDKQKSLDALNVMLGYNSPLKVSQEQKVVINEIRTYVADDKTNTSD